jgi:hypothetical protein
MVKDNTCFLFFTNTPDSVLERTELFLKQCINLFKERYTIDHVVLICFISLPKHSRIPFIYPNNTNGNVLTVLFGSNKEIINKFYKDNKEYQEVLKKKFKNRFKMFDILVKNLRNSYYPNEISLLLLPDDNIIHM